MSLEKILVIGATGQQGGAVVNGVLESGAGAQIRALVRNPSAADAVQLKARDAELYHGSLDQPESLGGLLNGVTRVFLNTTYDMARGETPEDEIRRGDAVLHQLDQADSLRQVIFSTLPKFPDYVEGSGKAVIEGKLVDSGLPLTLVTAPFYYENFIGIWPPLRSFLGIAGQFEWPWLPAEQPLYMPHASVQDFGRFVAALLTRSPGESIGRLHMPIVEDAYMHELLEQMSRGIEAPIEYRPAPERVIERLPVPDAMIEVLKFYGRTCSSASRGSRFFIENPALQAPASSQEAVDLTRELVPSVQGMEAWARENRERLTGLTGQKLSMAGAMAWARLRA